MTSDPRPSTVPVSWRATLAAAAVALVLCASILLAPHAQAADALASTSDGGAELSGGYAWLAAAAFVLLIVGSVGRIIGMRMLYKNRKARKDRETDGL
ncbi:hypothetical protein SANBI_000104 [Sanguibacter sp. 4.1]|uniref:Uncharacterized protein n=1 Tax=Sanguibacter biliveldensis TaxID=3030830 RepID=A0AAF0Z861_9MICO|nr:hypothetical protein [Sanguibacter sp. 4.1]WPF82499.1 hypothetical protein SANBI_000104 [Sanguibacter sp. 4.1]